MKNNRLIITLIALFLLGFGLKAQTASTEETAAQKEKRMEWFAQAKLGIFIHWGIYAVNGVSESWSFFNNYLPYEEYMAQEKGFTVLLHYFRLRNLQVHLSNTIWHCGLRSR